MVVNKTLTAEMPAESLAGRVDIKTYAPLRNPSLRFSTPRGLGFVTVGNGPQEQFGDRASCAIDKIGIVVGGSHFQFQQQTDNAEPRYDATGVSQLRTATYVVTRETNSLSGTIQYEPAPGHCISATSLYSEFKPEQANGFDSSLKCYFGTSSILSANGFYRRVRDVLYSAPRTVGDDRFDGAGLDRSRGTSGRSRPAGS